MERKASPIPPVSWIPYARTEQRIDVSDIFMRPGTCSFRARVACIYYYILYQSTHRLRISDMSFFQSISSFICWALSSANFFCFSFDLSCFLTKRSVSTLASG